jgi:hypothetical protein
MSQNLIFSIKPLSIRPSTRVVHRNRGTRQRSAAAAKFGNDSYRLFPCFLLRGRGRPTEALL